MSVLWECVLNVLCPGCAFWVYAAVFKCTAIGHMPSKHQFNLRCLWDIATICFILFIAWGSKVGNSFVIERILLISTKGPPPPLMLLKMQSPDDTEPLENSYTQQHCIICCDTIIKPVVTGHYCAFIVMCVKKGGTQKEARSSIWVQGDYIILLCILCRDDPPASILSNSSLLLSTLVSPAHFQLSLPIISHLSGPLGFCISKCNFAYSDLTVKDCFH